MHRVAMELCNDEKVLPGAPDHATFKSPAVSKVQTHKVSRSRFSIGEHHSNLLDEIMEQPQSVMDAIKGRCGTSPKPFVNFEELKKANMSTKLRNAHRIVICACGTSHNAAIFGEYLIEQFARVPTKAEYASEFRYKHDRLNPQRDVLIVISQSGETADTLAALRMATKANVPVLAIVNDADSAMVREADTSILLRSGPEETVASTKAFTSSLVILTLLALSLARERGEIDEARLGKALLEIEKLPKKLGELIVHCNESVKYAARVFRYSHNFLYLGRGFNFPIAMEGALKMKEIATTHAEGYPAAEMKHGPIALIDRFMPVLFIAPKSDATYDKIKSNVQEVLARRGAILVITEYDNKDFDEDTEYVFRLPPTEEFIFPIYASVPLQLLSLHIASMRSINVDAPANLKKAHVTSPSLKPREGGSMHVRTNTDRNLMRPLKL